MSPEYVFQETKRAVDSVAGKSEIYSGISMERMINPTFAVMMNSRRLLGDDLPRGERRVLWNLLLAAARVICGCVSVWTAWNLATKECCKPSVAWDSSCHQIRAVGVSNVVLLSDLGQVANGPPVAGFGLGLERLLDSGFSRDEVHTMVCANPRRLVEEREG